jgi:CubicO group peptidase (beta-lactamase class C family)
MYLMSNSYKYIIITFLLIVFSHPSFVQIKHKNDFGEGDLKFSLNQRIHNELSDFGFSGSIDYQVQRFIEKYELKGVSISIVSDEKLVYSKGYGFANKEDSILASPGQLFRLASVSKLITAVTIMKLVEQNKIRLDSKVFGPHGFFNEEKYLKFEDPRLSDITVLNLLNHSGGWTQRYGDPMFNPLLVSNLVDEKSPATIDTYLKFVTSRRLHFTPGSMYSYSNMGYMFLGEIITRVTGMPYEDYVRKNILSPMGIYDMHLAHNLYKERFSNEVKYYVPAGDTLIYSYTGDSLLVSKTYGGNDIRLLGGAGGWVASSPELAKLLVSIDGFLKSKDFLSKESINLMTGELGKFLGWKQEYENGWLRTGSFAGTNNALYRGNDGFEWVVLCNTGSWKGPAFSYDIIRLMKKISREVTVWPDKDLFTYHDGDALSLDLPL